MFNFHQIPTQIKSLNASWVSGALLTLLVAAPAVAQSAANFGSATLGSSASRTLEGHTQGTTPLSTIARQGANGSHCVGYGTTEPDHIVVLSEPASGVALTVNSGGNDTTLLVRSAAGVFCADDSSNADARLRGQAWEAGTYEVWVGSFDSAIRYDYRLTVETNP